MNGAMTVVFMKDGRVFFQIRAEFLTQDNQKGATVMRYILTPDQSEGTLAPQLQPQPQPAGVCAECGADLRPGAKFCMECGARVEAKCSKCGANLQPDAKFCMECGQPISAAAAPTPRIEPSPLDGRWRSGSGVDVLINGNMGTITDVASLLWNKAVEEGKLSAGAPKIEGIVKTGPLSYSARELLLDSLEEADADYNSINLHIELFWSSEATIVLSEDGGTFTNTITATNPRTGETVGGSVSYTRVGN
jgi:ribosomal protein L40E